MVHTLRGALPDADRLEKTQHTLSWRPDAACSVDLVDFEAALARAASRTGDEAVAALTDAVGAYSGDLLAGCYDDSVLEARERLRQRYRDALERLASLLVQREAHADAVAYASRLVAEDPLREEAYRLLMHSHDARGDRALALRAYHACAATLERALGVAPSASMRAASAGPIAALAHAEVAPTSATATELAALGSAPAAPR